MKTSSAVPARVRAAIAWVSTVTVAAIVTACAPTQAPPAWVTQKEAEAAERLDGYPQLSEVPPFPTNARTAAQWNALIAELRALGVALERIRPADGDPLELDADAYIAEVRRRAREAAAAAEPIPPPPQVAPRPRD